MAKNPAPNFKVEPISIAENDLFRKVKITPLQLVADLQCVFGFRGQPKDSYSLEVAIGSQVQSLGRAVG